MVDMGEVLNIKLTKKKKEKQYRNELWIAYRHSWSRCSPKNPRKNS